MERPSIFARLWKFVAAERRDQRARGARYPEFAAIARSMFVAVAFLMAPAAFADEAVKRSESVIVPYDPTKPVAGQKPDQLYLPYEHFLELWEAAKKNRAGEKPEPAPMPFVLSAARYDGVVSERSVAFTGRLDVTTHNDRWVKVPLAFKDVKIGSLKVDGVVAAYDGAEIIVEKPGRHVVEVVFEIPLVQRATAFAWGVPRTGATLVSLTLPDARTSAMISPGSGVIERTSNGTKIVTAAVGATDTVQVTLETDAEATRVTEPALAEFGPWVTVTPTLETTRAAFTFHFPKARQDRFTVFFENGLTLTGLEAADLKTWKLTAGGDRQSLEVVLNEPAREEYSFSIACERPLPKLPVEMHAPVISAAAKRIESGYALFAGGRVEIAPKPSAGLRQIQLNPPANEPGRLIAAYQGGGELAYRVAIPEARREARVDYVYQVNRRKIELIASLQLLAKGDDLSSMTLALPAQFEVQAVESARLQDWWREGDTLHLRFAGATPETTPLVVYLVRQYAAAPTELDVRPLALTDFKRVTGEAVIAAHKGVDVTMKLNADGTEIAPEKAATDFQILPPLERKRGFTFKTQNFAAQVALAALPAKTNALWVMHAQAHEGWVALSVHARLTMRQGSIDRWSFSLPAAIPEARVLGEEVRETRSRVDGDRRVYEVQFQNDVYESVEFTAELELPNPGETVLPSIEFSGAQMTSGFVLTDNASEFEMKVKTGGVDIAPVSEIPFLPELSKSAGIYRAQPGWSVTIGVERLEKAATRAAFVAWAEMTSALRRDGTEWHRASYRLQNRSLQFLPVRMPAGAELMSVRVAGQSVRADAGKVNGTDAILVPLIKTKPGDLSYDVELVYRVKRGDFGWWTKREFRDPELPGITVERTLWNVWLPEDRKLQSSDGNMEAVLGDLNKTEKLESKMQEFKSLSAIITSPNVSAEVRANAKRNWDMLCATIRTENRDENFAETNSLYSRRGGATPKPTPAEESVGKKGIAQQGDYVFNKRRALNEELGREVQKLADFEKNEPQQQMQQQMQIIAGNRSGNAAISANAIDALIFNNPVQAPAQPQAQAAGASAIANANLQPGANAGANIGQNGQMNPEQNPGAQQVQKWSANGLFAGQQAQTVAPAAGAEPAAAGNNYFLNDNVVLQRKVIAAENADAQGRPAAKGGETRAPAAEKPAMSHAKGAADDFARKLPEAKSELQAGDLDASKTKAGYEKAAEGKDAGLAEKDVVFNTARANAGRLVQQSEQRKQEMAQQLATPQAPGLPPPAQLGGQNTFTGATTLNGGVPSLPNPGPSQANPPVVLSGILNQSAAATPAAPGGGVAPGSGEAEAQRLQSAGRISLAVDFPTEGQVLHFKKVKSNAQLALTTFTPASFTRWEFLAVAIVLAGVLMLVPRLFARRVVRA